MKKPAYQKDVLEDMENQVRSLHVFRTIYPHYEYQQLETKKKTKLKIRRLVRTAECRRLCGWLNETYLGILVDMLPTTRYEEVI